MKKTQLFTLCFIVFTTTLVGQEPVTKFFETYYKIKSTDGTPVSTYKDIEGSPYLNDEFEKSLIYMKNQKTYEVPVRFNLYENKFEFKVDNKVMVMTNPLDIIKIELSNKSFVFFSLNKRHQFLEILASGKAYLLCKREVELQKEKPAQPYQDPKPAQFIRKKDLLYIVNSDGKTHLFKNKKVLLSFFNNKQKELETFIKKEKLKLKKKEDLIKLVEYYNKL